MRVPDIPKHDVCVLFFWIIIIFFYNGCGSKNYNASCNDALMQPLIIVVSLY